MENTKLNCGLTTSAASPVNPDVGKAHDVRASWGTIFSGGACPFRPHRGLFRRLGIC